MGFLFRILTTIMMVFEAFGILVCGRWKWLVMVTNLFIWRWVREINHCGFLPKCMVVLISSIIYHYGICFATLLKGWQGLGHWWVILILFYTCMIITLLIGKNVMLLMIGFKGQGILGGEDRCWSVWIKFLLILTGEFVFQMLLFFIYHSLNLIIEEFLLRWPIRSVMIKGEGLLDLLLHG